MQKERRKDRRVNWPYSVIGLLIAGSLAYVMHKTVLQQGYSAVHNRAQAKAGLVVELTTGFVGTYSKYLTHSGDALMPTPATYRAEALTYLEQSDRSNGDVESGVVGLPGREIVKRATDSLMRSQLSDMAASPGTGVISSVILKNNQSVHRSLWPFIASEQACADCHNRLQNLSGSKQWKVGDLMGAQIVEKNIDPELAKVQQTALVQALLLFAAVLAFWFCCIYLMNHFRLTRELKILAATDPMTGCINRREFQKRITDLEGVTNGALLMLDLDKFKNINDSFGHEAGDLVICDFTQRIQSLVRAEDLVARFGGEEFIVWLPNISAIDAIQLAERMRSDVELSRVRHDKEVIHYTVSIGLQIIGCTEPGRFEKWVKAADQLLYRAKSEGRNRIVAGEELLA